MLPALMQATSRESLDALRTRLGQDTANLDGTATLRLSSELGQVARMLAAQPSLRRALADPSAGETNRENLVNTLLARHVGDDARQLAAAAVASAWSTGGDLVDALSDLSHQAAFISAEKDGSFATVEDELFRFGRVLDSNGELEQTLSDASAPLERRDALLGNLIDGKVSPITAQLLHGVLANPRVLSMYNSTLTLVGDAAERRRRTVAIVTSPIPLDERQTTRLTDALSRIYGREISASVDVDRSILGGLRIQVGDDVIDGSISGRLDDIQRRFAS